VTGVFGLDVQHSRTVIALVEAAAGVVRAGPVGDGRRALIPNAVDADRWGSRAAEEAAPADRRSDPWREPFLRGVYARLVGYLGGTDPTLAHGYPVCLSLGGRPGDPEVPDDATARRRAAAVGLTDLTTVRPADALLCRWLTEPDAPTVFRGRVVAVACGETWTAVRTYDVDRAPDRLRVHTLVAGRHLDVGSATWTARLAAEVLARCPGLEPSPVALFDSVLEFGAQLRHRPAGSGLRWSGMLSDHLVTPLRLRRAEAAGWDEVQRTVGTVTVELAAAPAARRGGATLVLVGGIGAVWPFLADGLARFGTVWCASEPEYDLAVGAAWWPVLRRHFADPPPTDPPPTDPPPAAEVSDAGPPRRPTEQATAAVQQRQPPWLRD
jgi:hypothetical protein